MPYLSVDRDAKHVVYEPSGRSGSISRPRYVLQVGHIWCGRVGWWQFGQRLRRGAEMPCWARRLSRRDFEVFRFGTAMTGREYSHGL